MKHLSSPYLALLLLASTAQAAANERLLDPTRPTHAKAPAAPRSTSAMRLEAVLMSSDRRIAIVNGQVLRAGDRIGDVLIEEVFADSVRYTRAGQSQLLRLQERALHVRRNAVEEER